MIKVAAGLKTLGFATLGLGGLAVGGRIYAKSKLRKSLIQTAESNVGKAITSAREEKRPMMRQAYAAYLMNNDPGAPKHNLRTVTGTNRLLDHYRIPRIGYTKAKGYYDF